MDGHQSWFGYLDCFFRLCWRYRPAPTPPSSTTGLDGKPLPKVYRIRSGDTAKIQFRMLDSVNSLRQAGGRTPVELDAKLTAAAATHSRDMSVQNRPWHFGSDGFVPGRSGPPGWIRRSVGW